MKSLNLFFICCLCLVTTQLYSQNLNDYRTTGSGNWTTVGIWEVFNGTIWVSASTYPGQIAGTNDVTISQDHTLTITSNIPSAINSVTIGDKNGPAASISTLQVSGNSSLNTSMLSIAYDGLLEWTANVTLTLPGGASLSVERTSPFAGNTLGTDYGIYVNPTGCNVNKKLVIGTRVYSNCNGGGGGKPKPIEFNDVNNEGGNLSVSPTSNSPVCNGNTVLLSANPGGTALNDTPITYSWTVTSPTTHTFSSTQENPSDIPSVPGNYVYEVTITNNSGISSANSTTVEVTDCSKKIITNRRTTFRVRK